MERARTESPPVRIAILVLTVSLALFATGCGGDDEGAAGQDANQNAGEETGGEEEEGTIQIAGEAASDHGSEDVSGARSAELELDDFYFEPTVLSGDAGQTITLEAFNEGEQAHTFTIEDQGIDVEFEPGDRQKIEVTFPDSGTLLFICKFHAEQGMRGGLAVSTSY